jgi:hypothetical protein
MLDKERTLVDAVLAGDTLAGDIDDWVDEWHDGADTRPLHESLGFTEDEYALWVEQPSVLAFLLQSRKYHIRLQDVVEMNEAHLSSSRQDTERLIAYLRRTGRVA